MNTNKITITLMISLISISIFADTNLSTNQLRMRFLNHFTPGVFFT